jgi:hypothetical protein
LRSPGRSEEAQFFTVSSSSYARIEAPLQSGTRYRPLHSLHPVQVDLARGAPIDFMVSTKDFGSTRPLSCALFADSGPRRRQLYKALRGFRQSLVTRERRRIVVAASGRTVET